MRKVKTKISGYKLNPSTRADHNTFSQALQHETFGAMLYPVFLYKYNQDIGYTKII